jgi:hypothetical protein
MKRSLALLVLFTFAVGLIGAHPCQAKETQSAVPHCHAMAGMTHRPASTLIASPSVHAQGHGCCGLPGPAGDSAQCERACCLLAVLYIPPALAAVGPSDALPVPGEARSLSLFSPSIDHIPL